MSLLYGTNQADMSDHLFCIHAAIIVGNARVLYNEAWRLRRLMFRHARDISSYRHYRQQLQNIKHSGETGTKIVTHIEKTAHQILGTF